MITNSKQIIKNDLDYCELQLYDLVRTMIYSTTSDFSYTSKNSSIFCLWSKKQEFIDGTEHISIIAKDLNSYNHNIICKIEYNKYVTDIRPTNFNTVLIYVLNWYNGDLDKYLLFKERKEKINEICLSKK